MSIETTGAESGNNAPIGAVPSEGTPSPSQDPQPIRLGSDALIQIEGQEKPVKFSDYTRGFQSQFTKASQRAAQLERELQAEREARQRFEQAQRGQQPQNSPEQDLLAKLREKPYLSGEEAAEVVQSIVSQFGQRDKVLVAALQRMQEMNEKLGGLYQNHTQQSFSSKIDKWLTDSGYGPDAREIAQEIYLAYEGDDLDQEFPRIFTERMKQLEAMFEARKRAAVEKARRMPFVPGRGGQASPSQPLQFKGNESPAQIAEALWQASHGADT